jgi:hypothetical protein
MKQGSPIVAVCSQVPFSSIFQVGEPIWITFSQSWSVRTTSVSTGRASLLTKQHSTFVLFREDEQERRRDAGHVFVQQLVPGPHEDFAGQKLLHLNQPPFDSAASASDDHKQSAKPGQRTE